MQGGSSSRAPGLPDGGACPGEGEQQVPVGRKPERGRGRGGQFCFFAASDGPAAHDSDHAGTQLAAAHATQAGADQAAAAALSPALSAPAEQQGAGQQARKAQQAAPAHAAQQEEGRARQEGLQAAGGREGGGRGSLSGGRLHTRCRSTSWRVPRVRTAQDRGGSLLDQAKRGGPGGHQGGAGGRTRRR